MDSGDSSDVSHCINYSPNHDVTTDQLRREIQVVKELFHARLDGIDKATVLHLKQYDQISYDIKKSTDALHRLFEERSAAINMRFDERDIRTAQANRAREIALQSALGSARDLVAAQGEADAAATAKSEGYVTKQIDQIMALVGTLEKSINARVSELKERIDRGEGTGVGMHQAQSDRRAASNVVVAVAGVAIAIVSIIASIAIAVLK